MTAVEPPDAPRRLLDLCGSAATLVAGVAVALRVNRGANRGQASGVRERTGGLHCKQTMDQLSNSTREQA